MNGSKKYNENSANRGNLFRNLAARWIKLHRPDVEAVIREEVDKVFPIKRVRKQVTLPSSLQKSLDSMATKKQTVFVEQGIEWEIVIELRPRRLTQLERVKLSKS